MTGPTSVESCQGSPTVSVFSAPSSISRSFLLHILLDVENAQRRAALAGALEGRCQHVAHRLLRQRGGIDDHSVEPAGLGNQHRIRCGSFGKLPLDQLRHLGRTGEADPGNVRIGGERRADRRTVARHEMQDVRGTPASCSSSTARAAINGVCSAGLATTALPVASAAAI